MKKILVIIFFGCPFLLLSQQDKLDALCDSFCNALSEIENLNDLSPENSRKYYNKHKENNAEAWREVVVLFDSLYKINKHQFEELFRHQLVQVCKEFRVVENEIFSSNPEQPYQQKRYHLVQKLIYSVEDGYIDSVIVEALVGENNTLDLYKKLDKIDSIVQPIKGKSLLRFYTDRYSMRFGLELQYHDLESKKTKLRVVIKFNPMRDHEIQSIEVQDQNEIEKEREEMEKTHSFPPPLPVIVEPKN